MTIVLDAEQQLQYRRGVHARRASMPGWPYQKGVTEIANGAYAYLQPDGGWGWSNAGFVRDGDQALLIDTLFDEHLTHEMLLALTAASGCKPEDIGSLVNTHANGDHTYGNALLPRAEIYASEASARETSSQASTLRTAAGASRRALSAAGTS
jgi:glyoxylase-like metal-dependent hydrolase (beta-lactamase superfamily II)